MEKATSASISNKLKFNTICILVLFTLVMTVNGMKENHCSSLKQTFTATENKILKIPAIWLRKVTSPVQCISFCHASPTCRSVNYLKTDRLCQLNNVSKLLYLENFKTYCGSIYYDGQNDSAKEPQKATEMLDCSISRATLPSRTTDATEAWALQELSVTGKPSVQSSTMLPNYDAGRANDGSTNIYLLSPPHCAHTHTQFHPWWRVDLEGEHWLGQIKILNRGDCCGNRLAGATVRVGFSPNITSNVVCGSAVSQAQARNGAWIDFVCDPRTLARYISVDINRQETINICEVKVMEYIRM